MDREELRRILAEIRFCPELSEHALAALAGCVRVESFPQGATIFEEGARQPWFYLLLSGRVALEMNAPPHGKTRILTLDAGDVLAWSALLGEGKMTTSAVALEEVRTLAIASHDLKSIIRQDEQLAHLLYREVALALSRRLTATRLQLLDLFRTSS